MTASRIEAELDRLFALPLAEFVDARNALSARLKAAGDRAGAAHVKKLKKPSVPAWAVNQVRFSAPHVLEALLTAGDRLRSRPADMRSAMAERREALGAARRKAEEILVAAGHPAPPQTMQRVSATLDALAAYGNAPGKPSAGRLTEELSPPGFEELASLGLLPAAGSSPARVAPVSTAQPVKPVRAEPPRLAPSDVRAAREKAKRAVRTLAVKKREAEAARAKLLAAEKKAEIARRHKAELDAALSQAAREERRHDEAAAAAREAADAAERALKEAAAAAGSEHGASAPQRRRPRKR